MSSYLNYRVYVNYDSAKQKFRARVRHMDQYFAAGLYDTHDEAEMFAKKKIADIKSEKKAAKQNPLHGLSDWDRQATESRQRIIAKYGRKMYV